jgi:hypothetical protein
MLNVATKPSGGLAVMNRRHSAADALDFFPTPPHATRALLHHLKAAKLLKPGMLAWEPAAGMGHMADVLREEFEVVHTSDVFDYGINSAIGSFVGMGPDVAQWPVIAYGGRRPDWIITNPPFNNAAEFILRALGEVDVGVAVLVRLNFLEGGERYRAIYSRRAPQLILQFAGRVAMVADAWDPNATTATAYCWVIWHHGVFGVRMMPDTAFRWLPETSEAMHTRHDDVHKYAMRRPPWVQEPKGTLI